ncbi:MAG: Gfo/Idh/MocA family oxidoreductase [Ruminococcaceae bacterium]|nr:Gfo/Idh/MocA family oxidoreductase [Oscillospiraceae bacterium]
MAKLKIGVFGGGRGMTAIRQLLNNPDAELVAVCDKYLPLLDKVKKEAEEAGLYNVAYYPSFDDFIQHDMDAVILANYAHEHAKFGIRLLESGRHIMSECLVCANMKEAVELIETVERTGKIYTLAENYCYAPARWEMRRRYLNGDIGELMYAEGEYLHDCSDIWPQITYGQREHWRNRTFSTFYCTHSIGPVLKMTGLRPVKVSGFETQNMPYMRDLGRPTGCGGMEILTLNNGAIVKSIHGDVKNISHHYNYQLNGDRGAMKDLGDGQLATYIEGDRGNGRGDYETYTPSHVIAEAESTGHDGGDFYTTHYFIQSILGDEEAKERAIGVYDAVDMSIPGILAYKSIVNGNASVDVPNLRNKEERDAYRNDTFTTFAEAAGDQRVPSNIHIKEEIPDEVYDRVKKMWLESQNQ